MIDILQSFTEPIAVLLTIMILLYAFVDTFLNRVATHIFIGVAAGYAGAVAIKDVLLPLLTKFNDPAQPKVPILLSLLWVGFILLKFSPKTANLGNPGSALLVGVGAAVAIGGAIQGTLIPQISGATQFFRINGELSVASFFQGGIILIGTVSSLIFFHFGAKIKTSKIPERNKMIELIAKVGHIFISITFGVVFAGVYSASLSALINRMDFVIGFIANLLGFEI